MIIINRNLKKRGGGIWSCTQGLGAVPDYGVGFGAVPVYCTGLGAVLESGMAFRACSPGISTRRGWGKEKKEGKLRMPNVTLFYASQ